MGNLEMWVRIKRTVKKLSRNIFSQHGIVLVFGLTALGVNSPAAPLRACGSLFVKMRQSEAHSIPDPNPEKSYGYNAIEFHLTALAKDLTKIRPFLESISAEDLQTARNNLLELNRMKSELNSKSQMVSFSKLQAILDRSKEIYKQLASQDTRLKLFYLQSDAANYRDQNSKFDDIRQIFQQLENHIGQVDLRVTLLKKFSDFGMDPIEDAVFFDFLNQELNFAYVDLVLALNGMPLYKFTAEETTLIEDNNDEISSFDWSQANFSAKFLKKIDALSVAVWKKKKARKRERNYLIRQIIKEVSEKIDNGDFINDNIELGLHELRRKLRSLFSLRMTAMHGLVSASEVNLSQDLVHLDTSTINRKYVSQFPVYAKEKHIIYYPMSLYLKMMLITLNAGETKELNEVFDHFTREMVVIGRFQDEETARAYVQDKLNKAHIQFADHKEYSSEIVEYLQTTQLLRKFINSLKNQLSD